MIDWLKRTGKKTLNKLLLRPTIHKTGVDVRALSGKVDMLLSAGKVSEAGIREIRQSLDMLARGTGEQHEALADRFLESTIETRKAFDALGREMGEQHEALVDRFLEGTVEIRRALEALADALSRQQEALTGRVVESTGGARQALETLVYEVGEQREMISGRLAEGVGETRQALETLTHIVAEQREVIAGRLAEGAGETRQALETLTDTIARQHAVLAGRVMESAGETRQALETAIAKSGNSSQARMATFVRKIEALERLSFRQHEALSVLSRVLRTQHPLPATRGWAASPVLLLYLYEFVLERKPAVIVELGGGVSSLVIAAALKANGQGRLLSFDHDAEYAARTATLLEREGLTDLATVEHAPLSRWLPPAPNGLGDSWEWYTLPENSHALSAIDLLVVDGPPEKTGRYARYPALPALADRLAPRATVLLDDTVREAETRIAETWRDELGFDLTLRDDFEKGLAVLTRKPEAGRKRKTR